MRRAALVLTLTGLLAGCGGDDEKALSQADFIKQADAICARTDKALKAVPQPTKPEEIGPYAAKAAPIARKGVDDLRELEAPEAFAAKAKLVIEGLASDTDLFEDLGEAATKKDSARIEQIAEEAERRTSSRQKQAESAGFKKCGIEDA